MANIPVYCARKLGEEQPEYPHPKLEPVLKETFGVIIYQEQVMQAAQTLSGYSLGEADMLRRAMGKKIKAEMDAQRDRFVEGAVNNDIPRAKADEIFDLLAKFADYGFNKSHAAAYALISYQTAYLKANYPVEFLAASMTLDKANTDKLSEFRQEAQRLKITVEPPSVNLSGVDFEVDAERRTIRYALSAVKGAGEGQTAAIVRARSDRPFSSLGDFSGRVNPREVNKKVLESLAAAGAFDELEADRAVVFGGIESMMAEANRLHGERQAGQSALFGGGDEVPHLRLDRTKSWPAAQRLKREFDAIGFFLSGHPLDDYGRVLDRLKVEKWATFARDVKAGKSGARLAATVLDRQERRTKSGNKIGIVNLSDPTGQYEAIMFQETLNTHRDLFEKGNAVLLDVQASAEGDEVRVRIVKAEGLEQAACRIGKGLRIHLRDSGPIPGILGALGRRGDGEVSFLVPSDGGKREVEVRLRDRYAVSPEIANALRILAGVTQVENL
jgi:DNA polymerase-3 subunit alpha